MIFEVSVTAAIIYIPGLNIGLQVRPCKWVLKIIRYLLIKSYKTSTHCTTVCPKCFRQVNFIEMTLLRFYDDATDLNRFVKNTISNTRTVQQIINTPLFQNENERSIHQSEIRLFQGLYWGGSIVFWDVSIKTRRERNVRRLQRNWTWPLQHAQLPSQSIIPCLACLLSILKSSENSIGRYVISLKWKRKSQTPLIHRNLFSKTGQKSHWNSARHNDWFSHSSYLFPYSASFNVNLNRSELRHLQSTSTDNSTKDIWGCCDPIGDLFGRLLYYLTR